MPTSSGYDYATQNLTGGVDQYYKNINDFLSGSQAGQSGTPSLADTQAAMKQYGVSPEDIQAATGKSLDSWYATPSTSTSSAGTTMPTLTPEIASSLMQRSMTTGAPTSEFDSYGGYKAVSDMYNANNGSYDPSTFDSSFLKSAAQQVANTGVGNLSVLKQTDTPLTTAGRDAMAANGVTSFDAATLTNLGIPYQQTTGEQLTGLQSSYDNLNNNYTALQKQLADLTTSFNSLKSQRNGTTTSTGTVNNGSGTADTGTSNFMQNSGGSYANSGPVWGPDGKMFSSAAAAIAAGVTNYSTSRPAIGSDAASPNTAGGGLIGSVLANNSIQTKNPFAVNGPYSTQIARVGLPTGVNSPF